MRKDPSTMTRDDLECCRWLTAPGGVAMTADIECGNATQMQVVGDGHFELWPEEDNIPRQVQVTGPISCYNVCVLLRNLGGLPAQATLDVRIPPWLIQAGFDYFLRKPYVVRDADSPDPEWQLLEETHQTDMADRVSLRLNLGPGQMRLLSALAHFPYSLCCRRLEQLAASCAFADLQQIGLSVQGRPIFALQVGPRDASRCVLFTGTLQPGEPSAWAVLAMAELATSGDFRAPEDCLLSFVPQPNPDGIVWGRCNVNAADDVPVFGFLQAAQGDACPVEASVLWQYLSRRRPEVFIDFHFLRLPNHPVPKPYVFDPAIYSDDDTRGRAGRLAQELIALSGCERPYKVALGDAMWQRLATYQAARVWDSVSFLYQYTGPQTSHTGAQQRGRAVMQAALEIGLEHTGPSPDPKSAGSARPRRGTVAPPDPRSRRKRRVAIMRAPMTQGRHAQRPPWRGPRCESARCLIARRVPPTVTLRGLCPPPPGNRRSPGPPFPPTMTHADMLSAHPGADRGVSPPDPSLLDACRLQRRPSAARPGA